MVLSVLRDGAIILLAIESLIIGGLLVLLVWQVWRLVRVVEKEVKPLLDSANDTVSTMRGTTAFVSENVVSPVVRAHSVIAGVRGGIRAFFRPRRSRASAAGPESDSERL